MKYSFARLTLRGTVIGSYLFLFLPIMVLIAFSFNAKEFPAPWDHFTLEWYKQLFYEKELWDAFFISLLIASAATSLSLCMGALLIFFTLHGGKSNRLLPLFYGNLLIPETVLAVGLLSYFTLLHVPLGLLTLIVAHTVLGVGFVVPILYVRFKELDPRLIEASLTLGASYNTTFFRVILPLLRPAMIASGCLIFVLSFDDFILSYFCSGTSVQTLSLYLVSALRYGISPVVNALSSILLLCTSLFVFIFCSIRSQARIF